MATTALFVGWGGTHPGRETIARKHFTEWTEILTELKATGEIEDFQTIILDPHGGELDGFTLVHAPPEKLMELYMREDMNRLGIRARLDHAKFSVLFAEVGAGVEQHYALFDDAIREYEREPALV